VRGDFEEQRGFPGGPPSPPYGLNPLFGEPLREEPTGPPTPPTAPVPSTPQTPGPTVASTLTPPPPIDGGTRQRHVLQGWSIAVAALAVVLVASVWLLLPGGHVSSGAHAVAPPTTLAKPSTVTFPPPSAADLANCPHAIATTTAPFGTASTTAPGDLPRSGTGQLGALAWSIPIGPVEDPQQTRTPMYVVAQTGGIVVVSDATSGAQATATLVGLTESTGAPKWAITIPRTLAESTGPSGLPILDAAGDTLSFNYAEGSQIRAATISLTTGALVACDFVGEPAALGGPVQLFPVGGALFASVIDANGNTSLARLGVSAPAWSVTSGFDTVLGGDTSILVVGHGLVPGASGSAAPATGQSVAGLDAGTGNLLWKEPVTSLTGAPGLRSYDQSAKPRPAPRTVGALPYDGASYGTLDGISTAGETSFLWAPHLPTDLTNGTTAPSVPSFLLTVQDSTGKVAWGGWSTGNSFGPLADGAGGAWLATGQPGAPVEWLSVGPGGVAPGFPTQGDQAAAGAGRIVVSSAIAAPGSQYGTEILADRTGQIGTLSLDSANLSSDTQANGALSAQAWTGIARFDTTANLSAGRSPDYAIVSYRIGGGTGSGTGAPSGATTTTSPPRVGGQGGQQ
jgi:hypothetical protein